jgi:photosystem II stability/assembly factor-like uncharacterized protein
MKVFSEFGLQQLDDGRLKPAPPSRFSSCFSSFLAMIMATCCGLFTLNCVVSAQNWTLKSAPATYLSSVASSADGSKLVAAGGNVGLFLSTNSGSTWTNSFGGDWTRVASSADGAKLVAIAMGDVVSSTDSGATWQHDYPVEPERVWSAVASSADGTKLAIAAYNGGPLYASANSGTSWVQLTNYPVANQWILAIASSSDGRRIAPKVLLPGSGGKAGKNDSLCQKSGYRGRNG